MGKEKRPNYKAYLLRLWREDDSAPWRATLEDSRTGERVGFAKPKQLTAFLLQLTALDDSNNIGKETSNDEVDAA